MQIGPEERGEKSQKLILAIAKNVKHEAYVFISRYFGFYYIIPQPGRGSILMMASPSFLLLADSSPEPLLLCLGSVASLTSLYD